MPGAKKGKLNSLKGATGAASNLNSPPRGANQQQQRLRHNVLTPQLVAKAQQTFDLYNPHPTLGLSVAGVQQCLNDMGILISENQAKDTIFDLKQSSIVDAKNAEVDAVASAFQQQQQQQQSSSGDQLANGSSGGMESGAAVAAATSDENEVSKRSTLPPPSMNVTQSSSVLKGTMGSNATAVTTAEDSSSDLHLSFPLFLELITMTMSDCDRDKEMQVAWNMMLDNDKDGALGLKDIQNIFAKYSSALSRTNIGGGDSSATANQSPKTNSINNSVSVAEIQALMQDLDMDSDGIISLEDLKTALETQ